MKIQNVIPHILMAELDEPFAFSQGWVTHRSSVIVEVITDEGITGWGESLCQGLQPAQPTASLIDYKLKPMLVGRDVHDVEVLWEEMYGATRQFGQAGVAVNAISGVDIALWDAMGRAYQQPVCKLIGGSFRTSVRPYATGFYRKRSLKFPQAGVEEALQHIQQGMRAMKLKIGFGLDDDLRFISAVREAVGPDVLLMIDANGGYNAAMARRLLLDTVEHDIFFFEEPLAPEDIQGYQSLRFLTRTYIAAGEDLFGKLGFRDWIANGALDILQPDLCACGGFTEGKKIAAMAEAYNTPVVPHVWGSGVGLAASLQFIAALPPTPMAIRSDEMLLEYDRSSHPFRNDLIFGGVTVQNGRVMVPMEPGIGVNVNRDIIAEYAPR